MYERDDEAEAAGPFDARTLNFLVEREHAYNPDPFYFEKHQSDVTPIMRTILVDWMVEVCMEFALKRETFYYALNYVDRFLSAQPGVLKQNLQLLGVTAMYVAAKMEEVLSPKVADFVKSTDNGYSADQILAMEKTLYRVLGWQLAPPTAAMWASWYMTQWDLFTHEAVQQGMKPKFKEPSEAAYALFREVMQVVDAVHYDVACYQYKPRAIVAAAMYLVLGARFKQFTFAFICQEFPKPTGLNQYFNRAGDNSFFNQLFSHFLYLAFGFLLEEVLPTV